jgi:hypothetical protein
MIQQALDFPDETQAGIQAAYDHANKQWRATAYCVVGKLAAERSTFTCDDVAAEMDKFYARTHNLRALGPVMIRIRNEKIAEPTGEYVNSVRKNQHHCPIKVWRSLVWRLKKP